jgi:hypothetical protein
VETFLIAYNVYYVKLHQDGFKPMRSSIKGSLCAVLAALTVMSGIAAHAHKQEPVPVERKYSDQGIIDCVRKSSGPLDQRLKDIKKQEVTSKKAKVSIEPLVMERRRIEEHLCSIEARCLADAVPRNREHFYGLTLSTCLEN